MSDPVTGEPERGLNTTHHTHARGRGGGALTIYGYYIAQLCIIIFLRYNIYDGYICSICDIVQS